MEAKTRVYYVFRESDNYMREEEARQLDCWSQNLKQWVNQNSQREKDISFCTGTNPAP